MKIAPKDSSHWYTKDGKPCFEVPYADKKRQGQTRPVTLRDARQLGLVASVTTILGVLSQDGLSRWMIEQAIMSSLTLPRLPEESEEAFAKRVVQDMDRQRDESAEKGKEIEEAIRLWTIGESYHPQMKPFVDAFRKFLELVGGKVVWMQKPFATEDYGGTRDLLLDIHGRLVLADLKTQDGKLDENGFPKPFNYYDKYCEQLEGYAIPTPEAQGTMNIIIDRAHPGAYDFHEWTAEERQRGRENFLAAKVVYYNRQKYWPDRMKEAA